MGHCEYPQLIAGEGFAPVREFDFTGEMRVGIDAHRAAEPQRRVVPAPSRDQAAKDLRAGACLRLFRG
jgi:hypothetical protein